MNIEGVQDIEHLRRIALTQRKQIELLLAALTEKSQTIDALTKQPGDLQQTLALLQAQLNEAIANEKALSPPNHDAAATATGNGATAEPAPKKVPPKGHGPTPQPSLPKIERTYTLDSADQICPSCGGGLDAMPGQFETSEMIDVVNVEYQVVSVLRQKYVCKCGGCIETAPGPERAVPGGRYSLSFAAKIVFDKYLLHLPLARQERAMRYLGLDVTRQTLWDQTWGLSRLVRPSFEAVKRFVLDAEVVGLDQTSWPRLVGKDLNPWQMWAVSTPRAVLHAIRDDKSTATMLDLLGDRRRIVICDMLETHLSAERKAANISLAACWAHSFRRFRDAHADFPAALIAMEMIGELYEIDAAATSPAELLELRQNESSKVMQKLKEWLNAQTFLITTTFGDAIHYTLTYWPYFDRFLTDPRIRLDNNHTERSLRGPVLGRKNHYGSKSRRGTEVAAMFYTLMETAKLNGIDPMKYLVLAARRGARDEAVLPWEFDPGDLDSP